MPSFVSGRTTFSLPAVKVVNRSIILVLIPAIKWYSVLSCKISAPVVSTQLSVETKEPSPAPSFKFSIFICLIAPPWVF